MNEYLVNKLKEGRLNNGLRQSDVTKLTGIKNTTLSNYENGITEPDIDTFLQLCELYKLDYANILGEAYGLSVQGLEIDIKPSEIELIKKYRSLDPYTQETVSIILDRAIGQVKRLQIPQDGTAPTNVVELLPTANNDERLIEYFRNASAGGGVYILGNEVIDQIAIPATPENLMVDFAIGVSGDSMIPDFYDGDIALVSQRMELNHGDVGIFIVNNSAYIKEYGETELISRNPEAGNIKIAEYDNIVCMGKVIGKL